MMRAGVAAALLLATLTGGRAQDPATERSAAEARARAWMPQAVAEGSNVFQYGVPATSGKNEIMAYLWVPPAAERIRGLIMGGDLMMEANFIMDPLIREACAEQSIGILFFMKHLYGNWDAGDEPRLNDVLTRLAERSNHPELTTAPLMPIGHSAASIAPSHILAWKPERCLGAITYKGAHGIPTDRETAPLRGIPTLHIQDFVEEYKDRRETGSIGRQNVAEVRAKDPALLSGIVEDNGSKHPAWCFRLTPLIAEFIRGTAVLRLGDDGKTRPAPPEAGALMDIRYGAPRHPPAPAAEYAGDPKEAFWYPTLKMAQMLSDYNVVQLGKKAQYIAFLDPASGQPLKGDTAPAPRWVAADTYEVKAAFLDKSDNPALPQDPVGHATGDILFASHGRKQNRVGPGRFRLNFHPMAVRWHRISAYNMGDAEYRFEENLVTMNIPRASGAAQTLDVPPVGTVSRKAFPLALKATSSAGLPVRFTVEYGPAVVRDDATLELADVPKGARFPVEIAVWAFQTGSYVDPQVQAAEPVRQVIVVQD